MNPAADTHDRLERLIERLLRDQPARRAPGTLQARVLTQIERRRLAWWRRGFAHWPLAARLAFLAISVGFAGISLQIAAWLAAPLDDGARALGLPGEVAWMQSLAAALGSIVHAVPASWLHAGLALLALMYAALFSVGACAYRTVRMVPTI